MTGTRAQLRDFLLQWFGDYFPGNPFLWYDLIVLAWIALFALIFHLILKLISQRLVKNRFSEQAAQPDSKSPLYSAKKLARNISFVLQGAVVVIQAQLWVPEGTTFLYLIKMITDQWIILFALLSLFSLLDIFQAISDKRPLSAHFPLRSLSAARLFANN